MTADDLRALPPVVDVPTAGRMLGLGRSAAYELVVAGRWPTPVLRLGRRWRIPTAPLLDLLGVPAPPPAEMSQGGATLDGSPTAPALSAHREDER